MECTHPVLYSRNCVLYCQICGAVIDSQKAEKPPEGATEAATDGFERPSGRKIGFDAEKPKPKRTRKKTSSDPA